MAQVPYNPVPQVDSQTVAVPDVAVRNVSASAFGGDVAQSLEGFGKVIDNVGDEVYKRAIALQTLNNQSEAREAEAEYTIAAGELSAKYNALQGKDAVAGRETYISELRGLRQRMMEQRGNPETKRLFAESSLGTLSRLTLYSATHAATENRKYVVGSADASISSAAAKIAQTPDDPDVVRGAREDAARATRVKAAVGGWGTEQVAAADRETQSQLTKVQIIATADKEPWKAGEILEANRKNMTAEDVIAVEKVVNSRQQQVGAREIDRTVNADLTKPIAPGLPEKTEEQRVTEARKLAQKQKPGDLEYEDAAVSRVMSGYRLHKSQKRDDELFAMYTVNDAIMGRLGDKLPTNLDELRAVSPAVSEAFDRLTPARQKSMRLAMAQNAKGDIPETEATVREYLRLRGMANSIDEKEREEFLYLDAAGLPLPNSKKVAIGMLQGQVKKNMQADPRVTTAMRQLVDLGIAPTRDKGMTEDQIRMFRGALTIALDEWQETSKGRRPDTKEIQQIGQRLVMEQTEPGSLWGNVWPNKVPMYQLRLPEPVKEQMLAEASAAGLPPPTDEQMQRHYAARRYRELLTSGKAQPK